MPGLTDRVAVVGRTGSGKTRFGTWLLSKARFDVQPYIVLDWKGEQLFSDLGDRVKEIGLNSKIPTVPGLYIVRPLPGQVDETERFLWNVWKAENTGLYVDEGYSIDQRSAGLKAILTQGRSKRIPIIYLSQRPAWISRFVLSEANFYAIFPLNDINDRRSVQGFTPLERDSWTMPEYHSLWYDVARDALFRMAPVPDDAVIIDTIAARLRPKRRYA